MFKNYLNEFVPLAGLLGTKRLSPGLWLSAGPRFLWALLFIRPFFRVFPQTLAILSALLLPGLVLAAPTPNLLQEMTEKSDSDHTQITFTFQEPLPNCTVRRVGLHTLQLDFGDVQADLPALELAARHPLLSSVNLIRDKNHLLAEVKVKTANYTVRHYPGSNKRRLFLELKALEPEVKVDKDVSAPLLSHPRLPTAHRVAQSVQAEQAGRLDEQTAGAGEQLFKEAVDNMVMGYYQAALARLEAFKTRYPGHPLADRAYYLAAYAVYETESEDERFRKGLAAWGEALEKFPDSDLAPQAALSLAMAYLNRDYLPEADAHFKRVAELYPNTPQAQMGLIYAAETALRRERPTEAREILRDFLERPIQTGLDMEAYARVGLSYYQEGLYTQANDIFEQLLEMEPDSYQNFPELIYALGDGYFYLGKPELSRLLLLHAVNMLPNHPKADVMLAKIGDAFRLEGRYDEAITVYSLTSKKFPQKPGGLVSQMRLAEMGALSHFFPASTIFDVMGNGSRRATVTMYEQIVKNAREASEAIRQLALLRGGLALEADRDFNEAINWLSQLLRDYPKGLLLEEARQALGRSVLSRADLSEALEAWPELTKLRDYEQLLEPADQNRLKPSLAKAYEATGDFASALAAWQGYENDRPDEQAARDMAIIINLLKLDRPLEALNSLKKLVAGFPQAEDWAQIQLDTIGAALAKPADEEAISNLNLFRDEIKNDYLRRRALADSISIAVLNNNYLQGCDLIDQYLAEYPGDEINPQYQMFKAELYRRLNKPEEAWDTLSDFRRQNSDDDRAKDVLSAQIEEAFKLQRPDDAFRFMELYRSLYPQDPRSQELMMARHQKEIELGRTDQALQTLADFRAAYPQSSLLGDSYYRQYQEEINLGRLEQAAAGLLDFRRELPQDPRLPDLMLGQAQQELAADQPEKALAMWRDFRQTYPNDPRNPEIVLNLARTEGSLGRPEKASELLAEFRQTYPGRPEEAQSYLDQLAQEDRQQNYQAMINLSKEFRAKYPDHPETPNIYKQEARLAMALGQIPEALAALEEGVKNVPALAQSAEVQEQLGQIYLDQGNVEGWATALDNYLHQPTTTGDNPGDRFLKALQLAQVYLELNRRDEARNILDRALTWEPNDVSPEALYNMAKAYETLGDQAKYAGVLERLRQSPDALWRGVAQQELNNLNAPTTPAQAPPAPAP